MEEDQCILQRKVRVTVCHTVSEMIINCGKLEFTSVNKDIGVAGLSSCVIKFG